MSKDTVKDIQKHSISLYVADKPGVLNRIALVFSRRGFNIDSLVVSESKEPGFSQMNIVATGGKETLDQILKQLNKLVDVIHAHDYSGEDIIEKELALIKVSCPIEKKSEALQIGLAFRADPVDVTEETITFMVTGTTEKIDAFKLIYRAFGILEMVRTGKVLIARGKKITSVN
jgi:acetolactate synthase I/III small subunit